jgi:hypothetical protein
MQLLMKLILYYVTIEQYDSQQKFTLSGLTAKTYCCTGVTCVEVRMEI